MYGDLPDLHLIHYRNIAALKINALTDFSVKKMSRLLFLILRLWTQKGYTKPFDSFDKLRMKQGEDLKNPRAES
jgi:hypothetical protein